MKQKHLIYCKVQFGTHLHWLHVHPGLGQLFSFGKEQQLVTAVVAVVVVATVVTTMVVVAMAVDMAAVLAVAPMVVAMQAAIISSQSFYHDRDCSQVEELRRCCRSWCHCRTIHHRIRHLLCRHPQP